MASSELQLSLSSVNDMFRLKSLRGDRRDRPGQPENYPDCIADDQDFVFVHGYNVDAEGGDATHAEVFKRMYQSGYKGKFWGVSWYGDPPAVVSHYHHAVVEAFSAAHGLRAFLESFASPPDLAAHSLGNGVVGIALNDADEGGKLLRNYFALDAAMPLEAYCGTTDGFDDNMDFWGGINVRELLGGEEIRYWRQYPTITWASEWHERFSATDARSELTWSNRIAEVDNRVENAYNFYSSTEEVLRVDPGCSSYISSTPSPIGAGSGYYSWQIGEWHKGLKNDRFWTDNVLPDWVAGGSSDQCGWAFTRDRDSQHRCVNDDGKRTLRSPEWVVEQLGNNTTDYLDSLKSDPLFKAEPAILFSANGHNFVSGNVQDYSAHLDYAPANATVPVKCRDWLLAKAFPARSRPMGSSNIDTDITGWLKNYNMAVDLLDESSWPRNRYNPLEPKEWRHGDYKDVAYVYVRNLYKTWVELIEE